MLLLQTYFNFLVSLLTPIKLESLLVCALITQQLSLADLFLIMNLGEYWNMRSTWSVLYDMFSCLCTFTGSWMGNIVSMPLAGILCKYGFDGGWGSIFYVIGKLWVKSLRYFVLMIFLVPEKCFLCQFEKKYFCDLSSIFLSLILFWKCLF